MQTIIIHTDGGARGNPGPAGIGVVVTAGTDGSELGTLSEYIGDATNNVAEYTAIVRALEYSKTLVADSKGVQVTLKLDSQLVERQMNGVYKVKDAGLRPLYEAAQQLVRDYASVTFIHIPRTENKAADALANQAMDAGQA